jgi:hypothetical protein
LRILPWGWPDEIIFRVAKLTCALGGETARGNRLDTLEHSSRTDTEPGRGGG